MFSSSRVLMFPLPSGSVNFGPICESHTYYGEVSWFLWCVARYSRLCEWCISASCSLWASLCPELHNSPEREARSSCQGAVQLCWMMLPVPALLFPPLDGDGQTFALISDSLWEEKRWALVKITGKCKVSWIIRTLVCASQQLAMD